MYQIRYRGDTSSQIVYDPRGANRQDKLIIQNPACRLAVNAAGTLDFAVMLGHPLYEALQPHKGLVKLTEDGDTLYIGKIYRATTDFYRTKQVKTEGPLAWLRGAVVKPYKFPEEWAEDAAYQAAASTGNVVDFFFRWAVGQYNAQADAERHIHAGTVTVTDPNNYLNRSDSHFSTALDVVAKKLFDSSLGGYLVTRYEGDEIYLDYLADLPMINVQEVELARNLLDLSTDTSGSDLYTGIVPVGKDGLTITDLPDGPVSEDLVKEGPLLYSKQARAAHGTINTPVEFKDVTTAQSLLQHAAATLGVGMGLPESIKCKAVDLHGIGGAVPPFRVARYVRVYSPYHGYSDLYPLLELRPQILEPGATEISLGKITLSYVDSAHRQEQQHQQELEEVRKETDSKVDEVMVTTEATMTQIIQDTKQIILDASADFVTTGNFEEYKKTVAAALEVLPGQIRAEVSEEVSSQVQTETGDIRQEVDTISQWMTFDTNGLTLGREGDPVKQCLTNRGIELLLGMIAQLTINSRGVYTPSLYIRPMDPDDPTAGCLYLGDLVVRVEDDGSLSGRCNF